MVRFKMADIVGPQNQKKETRRTRETTEEKNKAKVNTEKSLTEQKNNIERKFRPETEQMKFGRTRSWDSDGVAPELPIWPNLVCFS